MLLDVHMCIVGCVSEQEPQKARREFVLTNFLMFEYLIFRRLLETNTLRNINSKLGLDDVLKVLYKYKQIDEYEHEVLVDHYNEHKKALESITSEMAIHENIDLYEIYEEILEIDLKVVDGLFQTVVDNKSRDRSGAYYTSHKLANMLTKAAVDKYIHNKLGTEESIEKLCKSNASELDVIISNIKIIDMSCGTGHFIMAAYNYLINISKISEIDVIKRLYGMDIDLIALKIIISELVIKAKKIEVFGVVNDNFFFGNSLIDEAADKSTKLKYYLDNIIYARSFGSNQAKMLGYFDIVIGNPPWEKVRFEDENFFSSYAPHISLLSKKNERAKEISQLNELNRGLDSYYREFNTNMNIIKEEIKSNPIYSHSSKGELNTYALFTELGFRFLKEDGELCLILKSSIITSVANQSLFNFLVDGRHIDSIFEFNNSKKIFPIDSRERFAVLYCSKISKGKFELKMNMSDLDSMFHSEGKMMIDKDLLEKINPVTKMMPNITSKKILESLIKFHNTFACFGEEYSNVKYGRLVHFTNHADYIIREHEEGFIPIYEGKFIEVYDNKFSTFSDMSNADKYKAKASARMTCEEEKKDVMMISESRFFIEKSKWGEISKNYQAEYSLYWRSLTSSTNRRTTLATILPHIPTSQSIQLLQNGEDHEGLLLILSLFNSVIFDYLVKNKLSGIDLTQTVIKQIPVPTRSKFDRVIQFKGKNATIKEHVFARIKKLYNNDIRLKDLWAGITMEHGWYHELDNSRIKNIIELDKLIAVVYDVDKEELLDIVSYFPKFYDLDSITYLEKINEPD